jgi:putative membrane-bound dehydrogenase-like protein
MSNPVRLLRAAAAVVVLAASGYCVWSAAIQGDSGNGHAGSGREALRIPPKEPAEAVKTLQALHGFRMDLLAAEPLVTSPVAMDYDENGRVYVVEMRDYPYPDKSRDKPYQEQTGPALGRVRLLEDSRGTGTFDRSTIFADGLSWPTGVACWKGGVFVTATPDIWYLKDTDGDGKADVRLKVFTGFRKFNVQAVINNLKWGLDHHLYAAGATNGGSVRRPGMPGVPAVVLGNSDFRIDPLSEKFELLSGGARFGNAFNDWSDRFICNIRNPCQHVLLPRAYLARNPFLPVRSPLHDAAEAGDALIVFRASAPEPWRVLNAERLAKDRTYTGPRSESKATGYFTSSSGITIYRGAAYPPEYYGNAFLGEVAGNLVHRQAVAAKGVTFSARRADAGTEFVRSTDNWFRPVNFANAPDGTLHIVDMYRETIEHPWSIPDDIKGRLDLESGRDRGRIYRLTPPGFRAAPAPRLGKASTAELVAHLQNPNSWWRETAHRLLFERQDRAAVPLLRKMLVDGRDRAHIDPANGRDVKALGRLHALWSLHGLEALSDDDLLLALADAAAGIREHAVRLAEQRPGKAAKLRPRVIALADDPELRVRFQVAFTLGAFNDAAAVPALARIARRDAADEWVRIAVLSSVKDSATLLFVQLLCDREFLTNAASRAWFRDLGQIVAARRRPAEMDEVLAAAAKLSEGALNPRLAKATRYAIVAGLGQGLKRAGKGLAGLGKGPSSPAGTFLAGLWTEAEDTAKDTAAAADQRQQAIQLLGYADFPRVKTALASLLESRQPAAVQAAAVQALAGFPAAEVPRILLSACRSLTPDLRREVIEALLSRSEWAEPFLNAVELRQISLAEVPPGRKQFLLRHKNEKLRLRALALIGGETLSPRRQVIDRYQKALTLTGDSSRGQIIFRRECQTCHRLGGEGHEVGPNLATVQHHSPAQIMTNILDPNREVSPNSLEYVVETADGRVSNGVIAAETATSITLRRPEGKNEIFLRHDVAAIFSTGRSLMPEGLEKNLTPQDMADLLAFILRKR